MIFVIAAYSCSVLTDMLGGGSPHIGPVFESCIYSLWCSAERQVKSLVPRLSGKEDFTVITSPWLEVF